MYTGHGSKVTGVQPADYLKQIPLFCDLDADEIMDVLRIARVVTFEPGAKLCTRGAKADCAYVLEHGEVSIRAAEEGQPEVELGRVRGGEILGELALIDGQPRSADVVALSEVRGYRIDRSELDAMRRAMHPAAFKILRRIAITVSDRLRDVNDAIVAELAKSAPGKGGARKSGVGHERARAEGDASGQSRAGARASRELGRSSRELPRVPNAPRNSVPGRPLAGSLRNSVANKPAPKTAPRVSKEPAPPAAPKPAEEPSFWRGLIDRLGGASWK
jgi:CRP-like cAMP-binding protein